MDEKSLLFLKRLIETPSPSGFEQPLQRVIRERLKESADEIRTDVHGNVIAVKNPGGKPRIMLAAHCDEVGFMVKYIDENGFIYFSSIGGVDAHIVPGQRVKIHTDSGDILGVVGKKPIHAMEEEEKKKVVKLSEQWIDIGLSGRKEVEKVVKIGDPVTFSVGLEKLQGDIVVARGLDDKMGTFIICEVLRSLSSLSFPAAIFIASTVQEEIGLRGARTAAYFINPDVGIAIDADLASDFPTMDKKKEGEIRVGKGPVLTRGPNINPRVGQMLIKIAEEKNIPHQISGESRATPTDANVIQINRSGVAAGLVSVPVRYLHTPVEIISLGDIENTINLLKEFVLEVKREESFIPL
ncbi:M42 family metallopeptidase [Candidatus Aerophobetes bacterium]|nr:M42 family metallopeptidase [Candidatus Aerophobetes bacterium]